MKLDEAVPVLNEYDNMIKIKKKFLMLHILDKYLKLKGLLCL